MNVFDGREGLRRPGTYLPELESLRGWAILAVVAFHYFGILVDKLGAGPGAPIWMKLAAAGNTGVVLFFVLSGFLLTRPFLERLRDERPVSIKRFYSARALRILPLYYLAVLVAWIVTRQPATPKAFAFLQIGFAAFPFSIPWWSLCVEVQFYLLLPWVMLLLRSRAGRRVFGGLLVAAVVAHVYLIRSPGWFDLNYWENTLIDRGLAFVAGGLAAWLYLSPAYQRVARSRPLVAVGLIVNGTLLVLLLRWYGDVGQRESLMRMPLYHDYEAFLWAGLMLWIVALQGRWKLLFVNPIADHFGRISYSLYLIHVPVQAYLLGPLRNDLKAMTSLYQPRYLLVIVSSFVLAWLLSVLGYQCIERPFLRLKSHLPVQRSTSSGTPIANHSPHAEP